MLDKMGRDKMFYKTCHINNSAIEDKDLVLSEMRSINNPNFQDVDGNSYLHMACQAHSIEAVELLLNMGADPNILDNCGFPPIISAVGCIDSRNGEILDAMLKNGLNLDLMINGLTIRSLIESFGNLELIGILDSY